MSSFRMSSYFIMIQELKSLRSLDRHSDHNHAQTSYFLKLSVLCCLDMVITHIIFLVSNWGTQNLSRRAFQIYLNTCIQRKSINLLGPCSIKNTVQWLSTEGRGM